MKKKGLTILLASFLVAIFAFPVFALGDVALATPSTPTTVVDNPTYLNQSTPINWFEFKEIKNKTETAPQIPYLESSSDVFWHFVANQLTEAQVPILKAYLIFKDSEGISQPVTLESYKQNDKMVHFGVYTPKDYRLVEAYVDAEIKGQFNLSHVWGITQTTTTTTSPTTTATTTKPTTTATTTKPTTTQTSTTVTTTTTTATTQPTTSVTTASTTSGTTSTLPTTTPTTTFPDDFPKTGETGEDLGIIFGAFALLGAALLVVFRKKLIN